jgi:nitroimidazol reductase NimA-like FMN-containing flavoprotein (pyridoxamine 5'-phosphate oxidase superfamily)
MVAVWYLFDGARVYVATSARSDKARNLQSNLNVSVMIDSRDVAASRGINNAGTAQIVTGDSSLQLNARLHRKYLSDAALTDPRVGRVFAAVDDVTIQITPTSIISRDMRQVVRQFFGCQSRTTLPTCYRWSADRRDRLGRFVHPGDWHAADGW